MASPPDLDLARLIERAGLVAKDIENQHDRLHTAQISSGGWAPTIHDLLAALASSRAGHDRLRAALETVLASAYPDPHDHPAMYSAWQKAHKELALVRQGSAPSTPDGTS